MSEALTLSVAIPKTLSIPAGCTLRQYKAAELLVQRKDDDPTSFSELFRLAGYTEATIRSGALVIRESKGVQRAMAHIDALAESERDKAQELQDLSVAKVVSRIKDDSASDVLLLGAITKAKELKDSIPDTSSEASLPPSWYRQQRRRALMRAHALGMAAGRAAAGQQQG